MKQYITSRPIKWDFKFWFHCSSISGYLYQMDIYLWTKQTPELNIGLEKEVVVQLTHNLYRSFCTVYIGNFFNNPKLIEKLFYKRIYGIGTVRTNRKQMPNMINDKQMKKGNCEFVFSRNTMACKWMDNRSVLLLSSTFEGMNGILSVQRRKKGSKTKSSFTVLRLSSFLISAWVELILWTSALTHIVWIESHVLDFTLTFSLIWLVLHMSIVTSFITTSILTNCLSLWLQDCCRKKSYCSTIKAQKGQYQCLHYLRWKTNLNQLIIMEEWRTFTR